MRSRVQYLIALLALMSVSSSAACQLVIGRVLDKGSGAPLRQLEVALVPDTTAVSVSFARATTDSSGAFYLDAPKSGTYRVAFMLPEATMLSQAFTVAGADVQREFVLDVHRDTTPYLEFQVEKPVRMLPDQPHPGYPESMRSSGIQGEVLAQFVVDTLGRAEMSTLKILRSTHVEFANAVRLALPHIEFAPAEVGHRKVRQVVRQPFDFCFRSSPRAARPDTANSWWVPKGDVRNCPGG